MAELKNFRKWIHANPNLMQNGPQGHKVIKERFMRHNGYFVHITKVKGPNILKPEKPDVHFVAVGVYRYDRDKDTFEYAGNNIRDTILNIRKVKDIMERWEDDE